jgi:hypothetical protein
MSFHQRLLTPLTFAGVIDHARLIAEVNRRFPPNGAESREDKQVEAASENTSTDVI